MLSALLLAAAASPVTAAGQFGKPRYLVKAFLLKADKTFDHATSWCGYDSVCTLTVGDYDVRLRFFLSGRSYRLRVAPSSDDVRLFLSGRSYRLRVAPSSDGDDPCCFFNDGSDETSVANGQPHDKTLYYKTASGHRELGTLYIALESLE